MAGNGCIAAAETSRNYSDVFNDSLFHIVARNMGMDLISWKQVECLEGASIANAMFENADNKKLCGHFSFDITGALIGSGCHVTKGVLLRSKPNGKEWISNVGEMLGKVCSKEGEQIQFGHGFFVGSESRDVYMAKAAMEDPCLQAIMPEVYHVDIDQEMALSFFVMERFDDAQCSHIYCPEIHGDGGGIWSGSTIEQALDDILTFHAKFLGQLDLIPTYLKSHLNDSVQLFVACSEYIRVGSTNNLKYHPNTWTKEMNILTNKIADNVGMIGEKFRKYPMTLVHNDFSIRNTCLRRKPKDTQRALCVFDWEHTYIHVPQRDVTEFIVFALPTDGAPTAVERLAEYYRRHLIRELEKIGCEQSIIGIVTDQAAFNEMFDYSMMELFALRIVTYFSCARAMDESFPFLDRVVQVAFSYLQTVQHKYPFLQ